MLQEPYQTIQQLQYHLELLMMLMHDTIKSIDGAGTIDIASGQTLTAGDATNKTFSGVIQGSGGL